MQKKWGQLFAKSTFFIDHKNYIFIKACAPKRNLTEWGGLIESKIRSLVGSLEHYQDVKVTPYCKALKLKLKQKDIDKCTHPDELKRMELLKKKRIQKLKAKKKAELQKKKEEAKLRALQLKLQREREEERARKAAEEKAKEEALKKEQQQQKQQSMDIDTKSEQGSVANNNEDVDEEEEEKKDCVLPKLEPEDSVMTESNKTNGTKSKSPTISKSVLSKANTEISINDGNEANKATLKHAHTEPLPKAVSIDTVSPSPKPTEDADGVLLVSNLSIPLAKMNGDGNKSKSPTPNGNKPKLTATDSNTSKKSKSKSTSPAQTSTIQKLVQSRPSNPYIYVAPDLQRKWSRRRGYGRFNRNNNRMGSQYQLRRTVTPNSIKSASPAPSAKSKEGSPKEASLSASAASTTVSTTAPVHVPSPNPGFNQHAFLVGKNQIACCQSFNNKILQEKAEKFGYECKAFVIGLKVMNRTIAIERTADGEEVELQQRFDFSRSVINFLKGLNHLYTDSHIIIELVNCHKIPHFLFEEYQFQRPKKEFIKQHQITNEKNHELWKSKSCIATISSDKKEALSATATPEGSKAGSANSSPPNSANSSTPKFDKDDVLMNDDSDIDLPGLQPKKSEDKAVVNMNVGVHDESKEAPQTSNNAPPTKHSKEKPQIIPSNPRKRKLDEDQNQQQDMTPPTKRQKMEVNNVNDVAMNGVNNDNQTDSDDTNNGDEQSQPAPAAPAPLPQPHNPAPAEQHDPMKFKNKYYDSINWEKKYDRSPTIEYAFKLYKKSQANVQWVSCCHDVTATATHVYNTCKDQAWKSKLKQILSSAKYGWNGCKYQHQLTQRLMFDLAHDIAFNYIQHKKQKKAARLKALQGK